MCVGGICVRVCMCSFDLFSKNEKANVLFSTLNLLNNNKYCTVFGEIYNPVRLRSVDR